jgi:hypothetical protein
MLPNTSSNNSLAPATYNDGVDQTQLGDDLRFLQAQKGDKKKQQSRVNKTVLTKMAMLMHMIYYFILLFIKVQAGILSGKGPKLQAFSN